MLMSAFPPVMKPNAGGDYTLKNAGMSAVKRRADAAVQHMFIY